MASINKAIIVGNVGNDPEVTQTQNGFVTRFNVATSYKAKDREPETTWHRVVTFGKLAEVASKFLQKGSQVYVEGRISTNKYTGKDGIERYSTDIIATQMQMLGSREQKPQQPQQQGYAQPQQYAKPQQQYQQPQQYAPPPSMPVQDDDIPF